MDSFQTLSSLNCELTVTRAKNIESEFMGCLFVRCYISSGKNKRICLETREISSQSNLFWNQSFSLDCFGAEKSITMLMQGKVVFELRWRNIVPVFGKIGRSQLLGTAELPWKSVSESSGMEIERWVVMTRKNGSVHEDVKPPAVQIKMKVRVPATVKAAKERKTGGLRKWNECGCMDGGCKSCVNNEIFALDAALEFF